MRSIKKRIALWHIVLIIGIAAIAIPVAARVSSGPVAAVNDGRVFLEKRTGIVNEYAAAKNGGDKKHSTAGKYRGSRATVRENGKLSQDYYDRRREYWEKCVDRRLEESDEFDDDDEDSKDSKDKKDTKAKKEDDEDDEVDKEVQDREEFYERRREHWRRTLDEDW